ncbi:hypothetical protein [Cereibacter johrii]|uniref:hypothetical protein n=1 Tax=Cereibacter johrii TaxID=445629 RepID=UPI001F1EBE8E|nr:hypothetical protein [Cereibacter johrii]
MRDPRAHMPYELVLAELSRSLKPASVVAGLLGAPERADPRPRAPLAGQSSGVTS